jgi:hypothetical protein
MKYSTGSTYNVIADLISNPLVAGLHNLFGEKKFLLVDDSARLLFSILQFETQLIDHVCDIQGSGRSRGHAADQER